MYYDALTNFSVSSANNITHFVRKKSFFFRSTFSRQKLFFHFFRFFWCFLRILISKVLSHNPDGTLYRSLLTACKLYDNMHKYIKKNFGFLFSGWVFWKFLVHTSSRADLVLAGSQGAPNWCFFTSSAKKIRVCRNVQTS